MPQLAGRTFAPPHLHIVVNGKNVSTIDFAQEAKPTSGVHLISGTITDAAGKPLSGVIVRLTGTKVVNVVTDALGRYTFASLPDGTFFVTPQKAGGAFAPAAAEAMIMGADKTGLNFTLEAQANAEAESAITLTTKSTSSLDYGAKFEVAGALKSGSTGLVGQKIILQAAAPKAEFKDVAQATTGVGGKFSFSVKPAKKTNYRVRFEGFGTTGHKNSVSAWIGATPECYVRTPIARSTMSVDKDYTVYGYLKPKHKSGTMPVRIYKWKQTAAGKWKSEGYVKAKASNYSTYTKYSAKMKLGSKGKWRLRAFVPAGDGYAATWSKDFDHVTVK